MTNLLAFLLLAAIGVAALLGGVYLLAGAGWTLIAFGIAALCASAIPYRAFYR